MRHDMHTHTSYSDGYSKTEENIEMARRKGINILGICDHAFSSKLPWFMQITSRLEKYLDFHRDLQKKLSEQSSVPMKLRIGVEIDFSRNGYDHSSLPYDILNKFDYTVFEHVDDIDISGRQKGKSISDLVAIRKNLEIPVGLAHNDVQKNYKNREQEIAETLAENDIYIELNTSYFRDDKLFYYCFSSELVRYLRYAGVKFAIGTDAHYARDVGNVGGAVAFVKECRLEYHDLTK